MDNHVMQGLWIGRLSTMERLCIRSFQANDHEFHLYTYGDVGEVPTGTIVKDANEILPELQIARFQHVAQFSNFFYYALLMKKGGWWVDMDNVCLKHFDFPEEYVFYRDIEETTISFAIAKSPIGAPIMTHCYNLVNNMSQDEISTMPYQAIGPNLTKQKVEEFGLTQYAKPGITFDPIHWAKTVRLVDSEIPWDLSQSYSLHLFHGAWNNGPEHKVHSCSPNTDQKYPDGCLYEVLKRKYL